MYDLDPSTLRYATSASVVLGPGMLDGPQASHETVHRQSAVSDGKGGRILAGAIDLAQLLLDAGWAERGPVGNEIQVASLAAD